MDGSTLLTAFSIALERRELDRDPLVAEVLRTLRQLPPQDVTELDRRLAEDPLLPPEQAFSLRKLLPPTPVRDDYPPYRPLSHLATGGMGVLWLAEAPDGQLVVLKTLRGELAPVSGVEVDADGEVWLSTSPRPLDEPSTSAAMVQRLEREARLHRQLAHPHIVRCIEHGLTRSGLLYMVLEYCGSGDVGQLLAREGALAETRTLQLADQVAAALEAAHRLDLVHRDIKPSNIFLMSDGTAKLADFGFARSVKPERTRLTLAGTVLGSPSCMAPEQADGSHEVDIRSDLYAVGCVMYACLTGKPPFHGSRSEVLRCHQAEQPPSLVGICSAACARIVARCLAKHPDDRYPNPSALRADLAAIRDGAIRHLEPTVILAAPEVPPAEAPVPAPAPAPAKAETATSLTETVPPPPAEPAGGGFTEDILVIDGPGDARVVLFARPRITLGKLRDASVELCLRNYPEDEHRASCARISRQHLAVHLDTERGQAMVQDLGSVNGTVVNGTRLPAGRPFQLDAAHEQILDVAGAVTLRLRLLPRRGALPRGTTAACDGVSLRRLRNRPELAYAVVQGAVAIGGPDADLPLPGLARGQTRWLAYTGGQWWSAETERQSWQPLPAGTLGTLTVRGFAADDL